MALYLAQLNVVLALFNLLPGIPLDGGRLMRAALWWRTGDRWGATRIAAACGRWLGWGLIVLGVALAALLGQLMPLWMSLLGLFLKSAADLEGRQATASQLLAGVRVDSVMTRDPVWISWRASVNEALEEYFLRHSFGGFPVLRDAQIVGVVSLSDLARCPPAERNQIPIARVMTQLGADQCVRPDDDLAAALQKMAASGVTRLPVAAPDGSLAGLIALHTINRQIRIRELLC
jgi:CBS domain-containing protein